MRRKKIQNILKLLISPFHMQTFHLFPNSSRLCPLSPNLRRTIYIPILKLKYNHFGNPTYITFHYFAATRLHHSFHYAINYFTDILLSTFSRPIWILYIQRTRNHQRSQSQEPTKGSLPITGFVLAVSWYTTEGALWQIN